MAPHVIAVDNAHGDDGGFIKVENLVSIAGPHMPRKTAECLLSFSEMVVMSGIFVTVYTQDMYRQHI